MHAREWASPATAMYLASSILASSINGHGDVRDWMKYAEIFICPVVNPDG
jgi:murein tripeptide amidase MpaA